MLPDISKEFLVRMMEGSEIAGVQVGVTAAEFVYSFS